MRKLTYVLCLAILLPCVLSAQNKTNLFNGKNFNGWRILYGTAEYAIDGDQIVGTSKMGSPNTFLATKRNYTNFILEYEVKMDEGLNSGVQIRTSTDKDFKEGRPFGLQIECEDSQRGWAGGVFDEARKGWRYPLEYNPKAKSAFKKGEWNKFKVIAYNNRILTWVNGVACSNLVEEEVETGFIGLQVHGIHKKEHLDGKQIRWKNIYLQEIGEKDLEQHFVSDAPEVSYLKNELTPKQIKDGWKLLWDGQTTKGWRGSKLENFPENGWEIKDGVLSVLASDGGESANGGDIVTKRKYKNFIIEVDFKLTQGANSGIKYFVDTDLNQGAGSSIGCEFQILDDKKHPDAKKGTKGNRTIGSLYDLIKANGQEYNPYLPREKYVNAIGQWNRARIEVKGSHVKHFLNGCKVVEYDRGTQMWKALVAYSKYGKWPNFGEFEDGNILIQDHGDKVSFKNIKIKEL
ncbi:3-keto-disaccharide hydrolase [Marinifilum caeruleilacunae]|uniref:DUF1080 domain-containing protein n=1 Tax=Marinifilum caeruleilacunae TaxID=2499076 RepID=A0ABX1WZQ0_9BACT|nr:DUF1080 domain-containing protein [Marinifilum caeruleilacunae]NOU61310.1 DUF1080 domain-containing protein [Marinifilum caeruleilacunae]